MLQKYLIFVFAAVAATIAAMGCGSRSIPVEDAWDGAIAASGGATGSGGQISTGGTGVPDADPACPGSNYAVRSGHLTATPVAIALGESTTLGWSPIPSNPALGLTIDPGVGSVLGQTSKVVTPAQTTTYTLTTTYSSGSVSDSVTVFVTERKFMPVGGMAVARSGHTATLLADGKVLVVGGASDARGEIYDPRAGAFTATGMMAAARSGQTATLLANGKVLVAGGSSAELYDPATGTFTVTGNPIVARTQHTATLLTSGKVLLAGGYSGTSALASVELYDPATGAFTATGDLTVGRYQHAAALLKNGSVLLAGGFVPAHDSNNYDGLDSAEIYDPTTGRFTGAGNIRGRMAAPTAIALPNGTALVLGAPHGFEGWVSNGGLSLYDPVAGQFLRASTLWEVKRGMNTATLLPNGVVLVAGGHQDGPSGDLTRDLDEAELCDPTPCTCPACTCIPTVDMNVPRSSHTATLLQDGSVLMAGGVINRSALASAELYK